MRRSRKSAPNVISAVFDTVVLVRALINRRGPGGRLVFEHAAQYRPIISPPIVAEMFEVIQRPRIVRKFRNVSQEDLETILSLTARAEVVEPEAIPAVSRDPKDDKFLATAVLADADYLVSEDQDLLVLGEHAGVTIVDAATFLGLIVDRTA